MICQIPQCICNSISFTTRMTRNISLQTPNSKAKSFLIFWTRSISLPELLPPPVVNQHATLLFGIHDFELIISLPTHPTNLQYTHYEYPKHFEKPHNHSPHSPRKTPPQPVIIFPLAAPSALFRSFSLDMFHLLYLHYINNFKS
jgi:hypothetical protein